MKILTVCCYYHPHVGGIEQVARDCVNALKDGHEQRVICFNHEKGTVTDEVDGVQIIRAGCFAKVASQSLSTCYGRLLKRQFREFCPDVVIFHYPNPFLAHTLLKCLKKYPACKLVVYWHLDIYKQKFLKKLFRGQNIRLCRRAQKVVGATPKHTLESDFYPYFKEKCEVLPYGISRERLAVTPAVSEKSAKIRAGYGDKIICFAIGRHVPYKGLDRLILASKRLGDRFAILIAGEGELTPKLKELAGGDSKVVFLGKLPQEECNAYLNACDIFCFPSVTRNEAFGLALAEAMYFGKPSVTFTIPHSGVNYVSLAGVTGLEVENGNVEAYADAIETLAADEMLRRKYGQAAHERIVNQFTDEVFHQNLTRLIEELE